MTSLAFDTTALPPKARAIVYYTYAAAGLSIGATQVGYSAAEMGQPTWLTVTLAVYAFLGTSLGLTAAGNVYTGYGYNEYEPEHAPRKAE